MADTSTVSNATTTAGPTESRCQVPTGHPTGQWEDECGRLAGPVAVYSDRDQETVPACAGHATAVAEGRVLDFRPLDTETEGPR